MAGEGTYPHSGVPADKARLSTCLSRSGTDKGHAACLGCSQGRPWLQLAFLAGIEARQIAYAEGVGSSFSVGLPDEVAAPTLRSPPHMHLRGQNLPSTSVACTSRNCFACFRMIYTLSLLSSKLVRFIRSCHP